MSLERERERERAKERERERRGNTKKKWKKIVMTFFSPPSFLTFFPGSRIVLYRKKGQRKNKNRTLETLPFHQQHSSHSLSFCLPSFLPFSLSLPLSFEEEERRKRWKRTDEEGNFISFILGPFLVLHTFVSTSIDWQQNEGKEEKKEE